VLSQFHTPYSTRPAGKLLIAAVGVTPLLLSREASTVPSKSHTAQRTKPADKLLIAAGGGRHSTTLLSREASQVLSTSSHYKAAAACSSL